MALLVACLLAKSTSAGPLHRTFSVGTLRARRHFGLQRSQHRAVASPALVTDVSFCSPHQAPRDSVSTFGEEQPTRVRRKSVPVNMPSTKKTTGHRLSRMRQARVLKSVNQRASKQETWCQ